MRALHVAVHEEHFLPRSRGKLSSRKESIRVPTAGETKVERGDFLRQIKRILEADCERRKTVGVRERDGHHATDIIRLHARQRAPCRRQGEVEHALPLGDHAARGETSRLHDALGLCAAEEVGKNGEVVDCARGHAAEDRLNCQRGQFDHDDLKA